GGRARGRRSSLRLQLPLRPCRAAGARAARGRRAGRSRPLPRPLPAVVGLGRRSRALALRPRRGRQRCARRPRHARDRPGALPRRRDLVGLGPRPPGYPGPRGRRPLRRDDRVRKRRARDARGIPRRPRAHQLECLRGQRLPRLGRLRPRAAERARGRRRRELPPDPRHRAGPPVHAVLVAARPHHRLGRDGRPRGCPPARGDRGRARSRSARRDLRGRLPLLAGGRGGPRLGRERAQGAGELPDVKPVTWGILSTANINRLVIPAAQASDKVELVAVASRDQARADEYAAEWEIPRAFGSYEALLADDEIEAVYISLPNNLHCEWSIRAVEAGKHVLCEKPMGKRAAEVEEAFDAAERAGRIVSEAFMYRHSPQTERVRLLLDEGAIGELRVVRACFSFAMFDTENIRLRTDVEGGSLMDVGCYCVSGSRLLAGEPELVFGQQLIGPSGTDWVFTGSMRFANDVFGLF